MDFVVILIPILRFLSPITRKTIKERERGKVNKRRIEIKSPSSFDNYGYSQHVAILSRYSFMFTFLS